MKTRTIGVMLASAAAAGFACAQAHGQCADAVRLSIHGASANDAAGRALAMVHTVTGPRLIVGVALDEHTSAQNSGSASVFVRSNGVWTSQVRLFPGDPVSNGRFGASVGITDQHAVVGAPGVGPGGAAYLFQRSGSDWTQMTRYAPAGLPGAEMGSSVAIFGDLAVIGAPGYDYNAQNYAAMDAGIVHFLRRNAAGQWAYESGLLGTGGAEWPQPMQRYGHAVAAAGEYAVIGAPGGAGPEMPAGSGYVALCRELSSGGMSWSRNFYPTEAGAGDQAGYSVATDGTTVAFGAPGHDHAGPTGGMLTDAGCVHVRRRSGSTWSLDGVIRASDAASGARFGSDVALRGDRLVVAAEGAKKVYTFRRVGAGQWVQEGVMTDPEQPAQGLFGSAVAFDGTYVAAGDAGDDLGGWQTDAGAVYVFTAPAFGQSDVCAGAVPIGTGQYGGCTRYATREALATCGGIFQGPDAWHSFTPSCSGTAIVHTVGSGFDTVLSVHHSCPTPGGSSHTLACNDDAGGLLGNASWLTFDYEAGNTYYIRVSGANNESGSYTLELIEGTAPANDLCVNAQVIADGVHTFNTCLATGGLPAANGCGGQNVVIGNDVWFLYTAPRTGTATADLCGSSFNTAAAAYAGAVCPTQPGTAIACSDDDPACPAGRSRLVFPVTQGANYLIRVGASGVGTGRVVMDLRTRDGVPGCPADYNADGVVNSSDISAFITAWLASVQGGTLAADFNGDGTVNSSDISAFITAWLAAVSGGGC